MFDFDWAPQKDYPASMLILLLTLAFADSQVPTPKPESQSGGNSLSGGNAMDMLMKGPNAVPPPARSKAKVSTSCEKSGVVYQPGQDGYDDCMAGAKSEILLRQNNSMMSPLPGTESGSKAVIKFGN